MSNHKLNNAIGIDITIERIQDHLYNRLGWTPLEVYGRIYKNEIDQGKVPQSYLDGRYIRDVFISDNNGNKGNIFFVLDDKHDMINSLNFSVKTKIVFMLNLKSIYGVDLQRMDSLAQKEVYNILKLKNQFTITGIETGIKTVLKEFDLSKVSTKDIEPLHTFAVVGELKYNINNC